MANPRQFAKITEGIEVRESWPGGPLREFAKVRPHRTWGLRNVMNYQNAEDAIKAMSRCMSKLQKLDQEDTLVSFFTQQVEGDLQEAAANLVDGYLKGRVIRVLVEHGIRPGWDDEPVSSASGKVISISNAKPN